MTLEMLFQDDDYVENNSTIYRNFAKDVDVLNWVAKSEEEAYDLYCGYAHSVGFSVRKDHHSYWANSRNIKEKNYVCSKAGTKRGVKATIRRKYQKSETRTGCPAKVIFAVDHDGIWKVKKFVEGHNHVLAVVEDHHLLRSARQIPDDKATALKSMTDAGIRTVQAFSYLGEVAGGVENIGFSRRDAYNFIQKVRRSKIKMGDTNTLIHMFRERQTIDSMFHWDAQFDVNGSLMNFFWIDGVGRLDYDCFGDVLIFDTSYRLNKYNLACAPIIGVNNHWQNILLGVAFLSDETIESFTWLFRTFLRTMGDKHPITIYTYQDQAMAKAIEVTMPHTRHRLCQWHIAKKAPSKVAQFNTNHKARGLFFKCLSKCDTEEEFESTWLEMILEGHLADHSWLADLYKIRHKWSTAFNKDVFNIGILSTQRSESTNNVCHGLFKPTCSITDCFLGLERLMRKWRRNEHDEDYKCSQSDVVPVVKYHPMLKQAAKFYTRVLYSLFESEFINGTGGMTLRYGSDSNEYLIKSLDFMQQDKTWNVHFNASEGFIQCSCRKFETMGLLCGHCIKVLSHHSVLTIPQQYFLPRWSSTSKKDYYCEKNTSDMQQGNGMIFRNHICKMSYEIATRVHGNAEAEQFVCNAMKKMSEGADLLMNGRPATNCKRKETKKKSDLETGEANKFKNPVKVRPKGISNSRLKGYWETPKRRKVKQEVESQETIVKSTNPSNGDDWKPHVFGTDTSNANQNEAINDEYIRFMLGVINEKQCNS